MECVVFRKLIHELRTKAGLRPTRYVSSKEQLAIFLCIAWTGLGNQKMQEWFQRSGDTISKYVHIMVLTSIKQYINFVLDVSIGFST
jgi:hypothetical protein